MSKEVGAGGRFDIFLDSEENRDQQCQWKHSLYSAQALRVAQNRWLEICQCTFNEFRPESPCCEVSFPVSVTASTILSGVLAQ